MANLRDTLEEFAEILLVIVAILTSIAALLKKLEVLKSLIVRVLFCILFLATAVIPTGSIVWFFMYLAAENSNRIRESVVFLSLIAQLTAAVSLYVFLWGMWLYPRLKPWFRNQVRSILKSSEKGQAQAQEGKDKQEPSAQQSQSEDNNQIESTRSPNNKGGMS